MRKTGVKIKEWPFNKGERAKLTWIGEPFKQNNKWMFYAYFKFNKVIKKVLLDWASLHFLVAEKHYTGGDLNNAEAAENSELIDINLSSVTAEYREKPWNMVVDGVKFETKSKTFSFRNNGHLYTVPIIEIIRAVLAPSDFLLNRILEMDTLENYFTYTINNRSLEIHFSGEYESKLLKEDKINHLAWLLTNVSALKMFNKIGRNIWQQGELKFDFLLDRFNIKARVENKPTYTKILEIVALKKKRINAEEINIYHPSLEESHYSGEAKIRKYVNKKPDSDRELTSEGDGTTKGMEEIETLLITHKYERLPKIHRRKTGTRIVRKREDENTKEYVIDDDNLRSTADAGGEELIKGLEFNTINKIEAKGELEEFVEILRLLEKEPNVKLVKVIIGELPEGRKGKRFARLSDGVTRRKYAIGEIDMIDGNECSLIEVEREDRALSMLMLKANNNVNWNWVYSKLLIGLVDQSGNWSNKVLDKIRTMRVIILRAKHIKKNKYEKVEHLYDKINC